jgi:hypothetical protein
MTGNVSRRERPPWKPERGQYIRIPGTTLAIPELAGFTIAMAVCVALLIIAVVVF